MDLVSPITPPCLRVAIGRSHDVRDSGAVGAKI